MVGVITGGEFKMGEQIVRPVGHLSRFRLVFGYACQVVYTHSKIANQDSQCSPIPGLGLLEGRVCCLCCRRFVAKAA